MPTPNDKQLYLDATQEVDSGTPDPELWAKAMALAESDEEKARYRYIALRVEELSKTSAGAPPGDPALSIDSGDDGLCFAPDSRSSVESSTSPAPKTDDKPISKRDRILLVSLHSGRTCSPANGTGPVWTGYGQPQLPWEASIRRCMAGISLDREGIVLHTILHLTDPMMVSWIQQTCETG